MREDELPPPPAVGPDHELIEPEHWRRLGLPVPGGTRGVLAATHGLLRPSDDG